MTSVLAYIIALGFIAIQEEFLRKPGKPKSFKINNKLYKGTLVYVFSIFFVLLASPILNYYGLGLFNNQMLGWLGITILLVAIVIRTIAMKTLGIYFTRTLYTTEKQKLIDTGIYHYMRHPGYSATILGAIGFGLAQTNWIVLISSVLLAVLIYRNRINSEEKMLINQFGKDYYTYRRKTKSLIPFLW